MKYSLSFLKSYEFNTTLFFWKYLKRRGIIIELSLKNMASSEFTSKNCNGSSVRFKKKIRTRLISLAFNVYRKCDDRYEDSVELGSYRGRRN